MTVCIHNICINIIWEMDMKWLLLVFEKAAATSISHYRCLHMARSSCSLPLTDAMIMIFSFSVVESTNLSWLRILGMTFLCDVFELWTVSIFIHANILSTLCTHTSQTYLKTRNWCDECLHFFHIYIYYLCLGTSQTGNIRQCFWVYKWKTLKDKKTFMSACVL